jgi:2,3-bisphosphoglycerate-independent phosphoglycerate mutase
LPKAFEQGRDAIEAVAAGIHPCQHAVEFVGDAFLFGERGKRDVSDRRYGATDGRRNGASLKR